MVNSVHKFTDQDNLVVQEYQTLSNVSFNAVEQINAFLTDLAANYSARETVLKTYLDQWEYLGTDVTQMDLGSIGSAFSGLNIDPDRERKQIALKVRTIVPFYRHHDQMSQSKKENPQIGVIR